MTSKRVFGTIILTLLFIACFTIQSTTQPVMAQSSEQSTQSEKKSDETNLDTQLHLIIASEQKAEDAAELPKSLEPVLKQLRATLPFKHYRLATTLFNRTRNEGRLFLQWAGAALVGSAATTAATPSFNDFKVDRIRLVTDKDGRQIVRMDGFRFGARIPIQTGTAIASNAPAVPVINYETTGLNTDISMREGEPVIVGTMNVGPTGEAIIVVVSARKSIN